VTAVTSSVAGETKPLDPCALASLTTGTMLCDSFSAVHEAAEWMLGHPVWTHEFVDAEIQAAMISAVTAQFPDMPVEKPDDWQALRAELRARYGDAVLVTRGTRARDRNPVRTLSDVLDRKSA
jgi:hypothetical protein